MTSWSSSIKTWFVKQNVMKFEVVILKIDQKRKKGWWRGSRERIEKGSRERIEIQRKEIKGNFEEDKEHLHLPLLVVQLPQGTTFLLSSRLDSAVKRCNIENLHSDKHLSNVLIKART